MEKFGPLAANLQPSVVEELRKLESDKVMPINKLHPFITYFFVDHLQYDKAFLLVWNWLGWT